MKHTIIFLLGLICFTGTVNCEPIRVGVTIPLSGNLSTYGNEIRDGIVFGVERFEGDFSNERVDLYFEDACLPDEMISAARRLISIKRIELLAGNFCLIGLPPIIPILEKAKVLTFQSAAASRTILGQGNYIFATNVRVEDEARTLARHVREKWHKARAAVLYLETDYGIDHNHFFSEQFSQLGGEIVRSESVQLDATNVRSELTRIRAKNPEAVFLALTGPLLANALREYEELGFTQPKLTVSEIEDASVLQVARKAAEGTEFFSPVVRDDAFGNSFKERFGYIPGNLARSAYDGAILGLTSLLSCGRDPECSRKRVAETKGYHGASGLLSFGFDGGVDRILARKSVINGVVSVSQQSGCSNPRYGDQRNHFHGISLNEGH